MPTTKDVRLDVSVHGGIVRIVTASPTTAAEKTRLRTSVDCVGRYELPEATHWRCDIQCEHERPYVSHVLDWRPAARRRPRSLVQVENVCVFPLTLGEVRALGRARELLREEVERADVCATFALGGLPLLHWLTLPVRDTVEEIGRALSSAERFHLLPGLNWSGTEHEKDVFRQWLTEEVQRTGRRILIFDTGTGGNGVRQAEGLVIEALRSASPREGVSITVLGVLDGRFRCGRQTVVRSENGVSVPVRLAYRFVPHLPTEDCELLAGYQADRNETRLHIVEGPVLIRVKDAPWPVRAVERLARILHQGERLPHFLSRWDRYSFVASSGGGASLRDLVSKDDKLRDLIAQLRGDHRDDREFIAAGIVLTHSEDRALEALDNAIEWGLVPLANRSGIERGIRGRFEQARDRLLRAEWNRTLKKVEIL